MFRSSDPPPTPAPPTPAPPTPAPPTPAPPTAAPPTPASQALGASAPAAQTRRERSVRQLCSNIRTLILVVACLVVASSALLWAATPPAVGAPVPAAPVVAITAPVLDIVVSTADLKREMRMDRTSNSVTMTLDATVLFAKDSATVRASSASRLAQVAAELRRRGAGRVRVVGYTDDLGSVAHGLDLSRRRARSVAAVLRGNLSRSMYAFTVIGRGEAEPAVPNTSEANRRINRRVVVTCPAG